MVSTDVILGVSLLFYGVLGFGALSEILGQREERKQKKIGAYI